MIKIVPNGGGSSPSYVSSEMTFLDPGDTGSTDFVVNHSLGTTDLDFTVLWTNTGGATWVEFLHFYVARENAPIAYRGYNVVDITDTSATFRLYRIVGGTSTVKFNITAAG